ncbi:MAG: hypothetical protein K6F15_05085 [Treponema sp.]|nr:hypothetical protein [Treponema sp.]
MKSFTKKIAGLFVLGIFSLSGLSALDFGGLVTNDSIIKTNFDQNFKLDQKNSASLWFKQAFDQAGSNYFIAEAIYNFERDFDVEVTTNSIDSDLFKLVLNAKNKAGVFNLSAGRFFYCDLSGNAYAQNADGLLLSYKGRKFETSLYGAYTGLLNAQTVKMLTSREEAKDHLSVETDIFGKTHNVEDNYYFERDPDAVYDLAEKYMVGGAIVSFPNLFAGQTLTSQFLGTWRVEHEGYTRMYAALGLNGPIVKTLFYNVSSTLGIDNYNGECTNFSNLTKADITYYAPILSMVLQVNGSFASGEYGDFGRFKGFSEIAATSSLMDIQYSGIVKSGVSISLTPVSSLTFNGSADFIFDASGDYERNNIADEIGNFGFQYNCGLVWQMVSDFMLGFNAAQYFDCDNSDYMNKTAFTIKAALSF